MLFVPGRGPLALGRLVRARVAGEDDDTGVGRLGHLGPEIAREARHQVVLEADAPAGGPEYRGQAGFEGEEGLLVGVLEGEGDGVFLEVINQVRRASCRKPHDRGIADAVALLRPIANEGEFAGLIGEEIGERAGDDDVEVEKEEIAREADVARPQRELSPGATAEAPDGEGDGRDGAGLDACVEAFGVVRKTHKPRAQRRMTAHAAEEAVDVAGGERGAPFHADDGGHVRGLFRSGFLVSHCLAPLVFRNGGFEGI